MTVSVRSQLRQARSLMLACLVLAALPAATRVAAQAPPLDHDAYDIWRTIAGERISPDGTWVLYHLTPRVGDSRLVVAREGGTERRVDRVSDARFTPDSRFALFTIRPAHDSVRALRLGGVHRDSLPPDTLGILRLATGEVHRVPGVRVWRSPERGRSVVAYLVDDEVAVDAEEGAEAGMRKVPTLVLRDVASGAEHRFPHATRSFVLNERGTALAVTAAGENGAADGVHIVDVASGARREVITGKGRYEQLTIAPAGDQVAFLTDRDDQEASTPELTLYAWRDARNGLRPIARQGTAGIPAGWWVSEHGALRFSDSGNRLYFATAPRPAPEPDPDGLLDDERVRLDVWHWRDDDLQPMQLVNLDRDRRRSYEAVVHLDRRDRVVQLATEAVPAVRVGRRGDADLALAETGAPYRRLVGIEAPGFSDLWLIDVRTGDRRPILENRQVSGARLSPGERYVSWYDVRDRQWYAQETARDRRVALTTGIPYPLWDEADDHPMPPPPYGSPGWTEGDNELLIYDRYDIWAVDPTGRSTPRRITEGVGREREIRFRYIPLDPREEAVSRTAALLLSGFHLRGKDAGFFHDRVTGARPPRELVFGPKRYSRPVRAADAGALLYTREDVAEFPDLWVADEQFGAPRRVSQANPQQAEYNWATVELVDWLSATGVPLQGLVYRPADFDPGRSYPMMVYFYDRHSDDLHAHTPPLPHRSVIRPTFYASRGYIVFIPDVVYQEGYPGKSAMDAIMPGVLKLAAEPWVDESRVGIQGHSWGGYQIAYMITRTNFFRAAGAGAPVANMTSAYGGIRWATGLSRVFQYERTQSRIGGSLWEEPLRYIENSPLFALDRVETPVLIMHNEDDGHVPWEQGIELFVGLRRLGKPAWLINYNKQPHWPITPANMRDWNIRMQQFFDHFLKDAPAPVWLLEGIPATDKGRTLGLELVEDGAVADRSPDR